MAERILSGGGGSPGGGQGCRPGAPPAVWQTAVPGQAGLPPPLLSEAQQAEYHREGYLVVRGLVPQADCEQVALAAPAIPPGSDFWTPTVFDFQDPDRQRELHALLAHERILAAVEALVDGPARITFGMLAVVPAGGGKGLPWHQDNQYGHFLFRALNTFVAVRDVAPEQCMLWVAPRSHLLGLQPSQYIDGHHHSAEPANGLRLPALKQGDACIFHRSTLHRSIRNETAIHRYAYAAQYCEAHARRADTGARIDTILARDLAARWAAR